MKKLPPLTSANKGYVKPDPKDHDLWDDEQDKFIMGLYRKGYSMKGIASLSGRSYWSVQKRLQRLRTEAKEKRNS